MAEIEIGTKKPRELVSDVEVNLTGREARILYDMLNDAITVRGSANIRRNIRVMCQLFVARHRQKTG